MKVKSFYVFNFFFVFLALYGCSPTSKDDYQTLATSELNRFSLVLKKIHDPSDLKKMQKRIKNHFNKLSKIMIEYRSYLEKHPEVSEKRLLKLELAAENLKVELFRIYELDGGLGLIEEAQKDAYLKLSLFEQSLSQERIDMFKSTKPLSKE